MRQAVPFWKRLAWMIAIWTASVAAVLVVSLLIRIWLKSGASMPNT
jgi:hypothetical protein